MTSKVDIQCNNFCLAAHNKVQQNRTGTIFLSSKKPTGDTRQIPILTGDSKLINCSPTHDDPYSLRQQTRTQAYHGHRRITDTGASRTQEYHRQRSITDTGYAGETLLTMGRSFQRRPTTAARVGKIAVLVNHLFRSKHNKRHCIVNNGRIRKIKYYYNSNCKLN